MPFGPLLTSVLLLQGQGQRPANPFAPPAATVHYAPDRTCDLLHVAVSLDIDYPNRTYTGKAVNTLSPLRSGLTEIYLNAGPVMEILRATVDGVPAAIHRDDRKVYVTVPPTVKGKKIDIAFEYKAANTKGRSFGGGGGFHWIEKREGGPDTRVGFWTQGESEYNSDWVPMWDYPNDFATYEETYTVPADWTAIGNGKLVSESKRGDRKTFVWRQEIPHATYLMTAVGGPFDIKKDAWRGTPLWYVVPRGQGKYIDASFGDTPDMLSFYSERYGFRYPWAKYAQNAMYDFGGGMENVSATTLGEGSLTDGKDGFRTMASLNSHELGHQWFGDTVTCQDWGDIFNNESFATFLQATYFEHSRGKDAYLWEVENNQRAYLAEAARYQRPVITNVYPNADAMFDSHTYPKGGDLLHTLRRFMGDEAFFAGLKDYLNTYQHTPVQYPQLERALERASGIDVQPFFEQWFLKPGHPVFAYEWRMEDGKAIVTATQTQDTANGTPIYNIPNAKLAMVVAGRRIDVPFPISGAVTTLSIPVTVVPDAVMFDPDHDFLRVVERKGDPSPAESLAVLRFAGDPAQRLEAMAALVKEGTPAALANVVEALRADRGVGPAFPAFAGGRRRGGAALDNPLTALAALKDPSLRSFWTEELDGKDAGRRAVAVRALGQLPADAATTKALRDRINDKEFTVIVIGAIGVLAEWDKTANRDVFERALKIEDRRGAIAAAAKKAMG